MINKNQIIKVIGFCVAFVFIASVGCEVWATQVEMLDGDSVELAIEYTTGYPGDFVVVSVYMANPVPIASFSLHITLGGWHLMNFHTVDVYRDSVEITLDTCPSPTLFCPVETCYWEPGDTCMVWDYFAVRDCYLDTVGSLISNFETISCHGEVGDTTLPDCKYITVLGIAQLGDYIEPNPNFRLLFRFGVDLFCLCDADSGRSVYFIISPATSGFGDTLGLTVPFKYYMGELFAWWSVPGDASNDSVMNIADVIYTVTYLLGGGDPPCIMEAADADSSCKVNIGDVIYMVNYLFLNGDPPKRGCFCPQFPSVRKIDEDFEFFEHLNLKPLLERR